MATALIVKNAPEKLILLAQKWVQQGKSFYLGPENIFSFNNREILYKGGESVSRIYGSWCIHTDDMPYPDVWELDEEDINSISDAFAENLAINAAYLYITYKCNARCIMCNYHMKQAEYQQKFSLESKEVDFETIKFRLDKVYAMGIRNCSIISNGEVLVDSNWKKMVAYAAELGMSQYFISNGFLFTKEIAEFFKQINSIHTAQFSLHSNRFETWKKIFGVSNRTFFENAMRAPMLAKKAGVPCVSVTMVLQQENKDELNEFIGYWKNKVDLVRIIQCMNEKAKKHKFVNLDPAGLCEEAHSSVLFIQPSGIIVPCCGIVEKTNDLDRNDYGFLNIDTDLISKIKKEFPLNYQNKNFMKFCKQCTSYNRYGSCELVQFENNVIGKKQGITIFIRK